MSELLTLGLIAAIVILFSVIYLYQMWSAPIQPEHNHNRVKTACVIGGLLLICLILTISYLEKSNQQDQAIETYWRGGQNG